MENFDYIRKNYEELCSEIDLLAKKAGQEVTLVAVTKSGSDEELVALIEAGASDMGENRPQELVRRGELLLEKGLTPRLHEIGNLQSVHRIAFEKLDEKPLGTVAINEFPTETLLVGE